MPAATGPDFVNLRSHVDADLYANTGGLAFDHARPTVVFIHGAQHDHSVWTGHSRWFAQQGCNVLAFDLPGHGRSAGPALASIEAIAAALQAGLAMRHKTALHLVGHSMGSLVALELASMIAVQSLSLLGSCYPMPVSAALLSNSQADPAAAMDLINRLSHNKLWSNVSAGGQAIGAFNAWRNRRLMAQIAAQNGGHVLATDLAACHHYAAGAAAASRVNCPVLILNGKQDRMTPSAAGLAGLLGNCQTITLANCGHAIMREQPEAVRQALAVHIGIRAYPT